MKRILLVFLLFATLTNIVNAQERVVTGKVTGADGSGLPGVNVTLKGTSSGTITDVNGSFSLNIGR